MLNKQKIVKALLLSFLFLVVTVFVFYGVQWFSNSMENLLIHGSAVAPASLETSIEKANASSGSLTVLDKNLLPIRNWQVENVSLQVRAGLSLEIGGNNPKVLFSKNAEERFPIASLTKLMVAEVVLKNYNLSAKVVISENAMAQIGEQGELKLGQELSIKSLLYTTLMESNNRAAYALSEVSGNAKFISLMNQDAKNLGMNNTHFADVAGLDSNSYSTAKDLAVLTEYLFRNYPLFGQIISQKEYDLYLYDGSFGHKAINTNLLLGENHIIGGKTGFTNEAQGCFMVLQESSQKEDYVISIVLGAQDRFLEMQKLINWIALAYRW